MEDDTRVQWTIEPKLQEFIDGDQCNRTGYQRKERHRRPQYQQQDNGNQHHCRAYAFNQVVEASMPGRNMAAM